MSGELSEWIFEYCEVIADVEDFKELVGTLI